MIRLKDIKKRIGTFQLDLSLTIRKGEYFVILGPIGAGKTSLLNIIAGLCRPDKGRIEIDGKDITHYSPEKRNIGYIFQQDQLFPHMTVEENVKFGLRMRTLSKHEIESKARNILKAMNILHLSKRFPKTLSQGQKQKVAIARALVIEPSVLLLDEPLQNLDAGEKEHMIKELKSIQERFNITIIHVTHDQEEAFILADKMAIMNEGRIVQIGTPKEAFQRPASEFVAKFVRSENLFFGFSKISEGLAKIRVEELEINAVSEKEGKVLICIRPEEIFLHKTRPSNLSAQNILEGEIVEILDLGSTVKVKVHALKDFTVLITKRAFLDMNLKIGSKAYISFKASSVHVI